MKIKLNLQKKILLLVIGFSAIIYSITIGYISTSAKKNALSDAVSITLSTAQKNASDIKRLLEKDLTAMNILSQSVLSYKEMPEEQWKKVFATMYEEAIIANPHFLSIWDSWELSHIDKTYDKSYGRYKAELWREGNQVKSKFYLSSLTGDAPAYARIKSSSRNSIENPYFYSFSGKESDNILVTSVVSPIIEKGKFIGVVGLDIALDNYHPIINQIRPFKDSYAFLISNNLHYVAHPDKQKHGQSLVDDYEDVLNRFAVTEKIVNGEEHTFFSNDINGVKSFFVFTPIFIGDTSTPWSLAVIVPESTILAKANSNFVISIVAGIFGLLLLSLIIIFSSRTIVSPIASITSVLKQMAEGNISNDMKLDINSNDEIGEMAQALNTSIDGLNQKVDFALNIERGKLDSNYEVLSSKDVLGEALLDMRNSIAKASKDEEIRKAEDQKRAWANEGLAKFAEILRQNNDNMEVLAKSIIRELVNALNANQAGLFLLNDDDENEPHFELTAAFAYNRYKFKQKKVLLGEGLIGACAIEKKTVLLTEIPDGYIEITSGLGKSNPTSLIIVPLIIEEDVLGVIEIASFNNLEQYQVEFAEKVAQSIASTITSVKINIRTSHLLAKTQQQAEEMAAQEEEMRQNMEELQATQEESGRKTGEMQSFIDALNNSSFVIEYDSLGYITSINQGYLELLGLNRDEVVGTHHSDKLDLEPDKKKEYDAMWLSLRNGIPQKQVNRFNVHGKSFTFQETYTPIKNEMGEVYKILKISNNITNLVANK